MTGEYERSMGSALGATELKWRHGFAATLHVTGSAMAPAWYLLAATAVAQVALMLIPESAPARIAAMREAKVAAAVSAQPK
jgi:hypothetical protein